MRIIETVEELDAFSNDWLKFISTPVNGSCLWNHPHQIRHVLKWNPSIRPAITVLEDDGRICCIAPLYFAPDKYRLRFSYIKLARFRMYRLRMFGSYFIVRADCDHNAMASRIFKVITEWRDRFNALYLDRIDCSSPLWNFLHGKAFAKSGFRLMEERFAVENTFEIRFDGDHDQYLATLNRKTRQNLRRTTHKLFKEQNAEIRKFSRPDQVTGFLYDLDIIYRNTWQAKTFGYHARNSQRDIAYTTNLAEEGWLRSYVLYIDTTPVAFENTLQFGDRCEFKECGFDQQWAWWGVGTILINLAIKDILDEAEGRITIDLGIGSSAYKRSFCNHQICLASLRFYWPSMRTAPIMLQKLLIRIEGLARRVVVYLGLENQIRKLLNRKKERDS